MPSSLNLKWRVGSSNGELMTGFSIITEGNFDESPLNPIGHQQKELNGKLPASINCSVGWKRAKWKSRGVSEAHCPHKKVHDRSERRKKMSIQC